MAESHVNETLDLRGCLLYDFLKGESAAAAHRSICSVIGDKSLVYLLVRPWFNRIRKSDQPFEGKRAHFQVSVPTSRKLWKLSRESLFVKCLLLSVYLL
ncbi:hypothetical protein B9Z55_007422 [Caenorhabditis nigoni]|uniref:Mos1 transposase HTH domain-containing protein n=1 Tax=Caenorhabditis nigoni TaxID=1611254 RepID=A0A2G5V9P4_9PELO|nr:hypothetical protein B9Z55_007422 [Caenorhabditis nigoni]